MSRLHQLHFSRFYAWLKEPLSQRAREYIRQTELIRQAWADSGKVYVYRKLTDDLRVQGESILENRAHAWHPWLGSPHNLAKSAVPAAIAASQPSWPRTNWSGSFKRLVPIRPG